MFNDSSPLPPGAPGTKKYEGPWFEYQLAISLALGLSSFLLFSYARTRWPLSFAPRTKLKGFSPHEAHAHQAFFGWILPTIKTSEFTVLQIVGLDAAVLLSFFKTCFYLFSLCSLYAIAILMPINWSHNKDLLKSPGDGDDEDDFPYSLPSLLSTPNYSNLNATLPNDSSWLDLISEANTYLSLHLISTYLITLLALLFLSRNSSRFLRTRQLFSLELTHSIPARTVLITHLPLHLRSEKKLAEYFEAIDLAVESVSLVREVASLKHLLDRRTNALLELEKAWCKYVGNPSTVEEYDGPEGPLVDIESQNDRLTGARPRQLVVPHRKRPTIRPKWYKGKVDALEYLEKEYQDADEAFRKRRRTGKFRATQAAFVTFEKMSSAQIAIQSTHFPLPIQMTTYPAPEPRDIVWSNMTPTPTALLSRDVVVLACIGFLFAFWLFPITALAGLLSLDEIKKNWPWLGEVIESNKTVQALVQNSLPSIVMPLLNALLPTILEALSYVQGFRARSWVEYSVLKKYFLFLLVNVVFIFLLASTYIQLIADLANFPAKIPEKLAAALGTGRARYFFLSYAILQGLGVMPLQLLNLGVIVPRVLMRVFVTRTPRDYAELNAPPMINYGVVYPQAILMFVITILYSVVQPLILIFGAIYFGVAYVVYKYKLLFVFYKPYESQGQAWPITFVRLIWGIVIFLLFQTGYFALKRAIVTSVLVIPLIAIVLLWAYWMYKTQMPLSRFVALSSVCEVERGVESEDVARLREGHPVTWSQSNLNRRRYAQNDDTLYVAPEDERTDYSQPPMANWYTGVLNTGKRRYGHPALNGVLPEPWLPLKKGQTLVNSGARTPNGDNGGGTTAPASNGWGLRGRGGAKKNENLAVVLTLRKRSSMVRSHGGRRSIVATPVASASRGEFRDDGGDGDGAGAGREDGSAEGQGQSAASEGNPWSDHTPTRRSHSLSVPPLRHRLSFDEASGVIMLPEQDDWMGAGADEETDSDEEDYGNAASAATPTSRTNLASQSNPSILLGGAMSGSPAQSRVRLRMDSAATGTSATTAQSQTQSRRESAAVSDDSDARGGGAPTGGGGAATPTAQTADRGGEDTDAEDDGFAPPTPSRTSRYGTYFHHPERRRQQIPGAFPR